MTNYNPLDTICRINAFIDYTPAEQQHLLPMIYEARQWMIDARKDSLKNIRTFNCGFANGVEQGIGALMYQISNTPAVLAACRVEATDE